MRNKIILCFILSLFFLFGNNTNVYGWTCCKSASDISSTCPGGGGSCTITNHSCCDSNTATYCNSVSQCSVSTPVCPSGYSTSCSSGNCSSCTVTCTGCSNSVTCYKDNPTTTACNTTCPSNKYHKTECPNGWTESGCSAISQPSGCTDTYTCCDCIPPAIACRSASDCGSDSCLRYTCNNAGTTSAYCSSVDNGSCNQGVTDSCTFVSDPCYVTINGQCYPQTTTVNFTGGLIQPYNCSCKKAYQKDWGCWPDFPYACYSPEGVKSCYDTEVCSYCGGTATCQFPTCTSGCTSDGVHPWLITENCGRDDCEEANYWANTAFYIFCRSDWGDYTCLNQVDGKTYCYEDEMCDYCDGPCVTDACPTECHTNSVLVRDGADVNGFCKQRWCYPTSSVNGVCGNSNGGTFLTAPTVDLCSAGTPSLVTTSGYTYSWTCSGNCTGTVANCTAFANSPPVFQSFFLKSNTRNVVPAETGNRNQICQTIFNGSNTVKVTVTATDPDGVSDIKSIELKWNNNTIIPGAILNGTASFTYTFNSSQYSNGTYPFLVNITDSVNNTTGWINSGRSFKFWDCKVPISGTIYDGTDGASCPNTGFGVTNPDALNLKDLTFNQNGIDFTMSIGSDKTSYYSDSNNSLIWGSNIAIPQFNKVDNDIALSNPILIKTLTSSGVSACSNDYYIDTSIADPYAASVGITADFTGTLIQDPWFQAQNGGVISNSKVKDRVPSTCTNNDNCKISIDGLVAAPDVSNKGKSLETGNAQTWYYSNTLAKLADYNTNYDYFYSQYFVKKGVGVTLIGDQTLSTSTIGTTGIYFISGNLNINTNKTLTDLSDFLMIIAKEKITVDQSVNRVDGVLVASDIGASGASGDQLVFNGSLYASNTINFSRDFSSRVTNNSTPAVVVNYDPKLIFNMPGDIAKVLTNWQWGN